MFGYVPKEQFQCNRISEISLLLTSGEDNSSDNDSVQH